MSNKDDLSIFEDMLSQNRRALDHLLEHGVPRSQPTARRQPENTEEARPGGAETASHSARPGRQSPQPGRGSSARLEARSGEISFTFQTGRSPV
jgi:hypothetical protein